MQTQPHLQTVLSVMPSVGSALVASLCGMLVSGCMYKPNVPARFTAPSVVWAFEPAERGAFVATPLVAGERVFAAAIHTSAFATHGVLYCLDRTTGKRVWSFDDDGGMQHMYSSPCLADGCIYIGEGMHANFVCKLYCVDAVTGQKRWHFETAGHIESTPRVVDGHVYFCAGDDGLYCLDARSGQKRWQFRGPVHLDSNPAVEGGRVYVGSGISRLHRQPEVLCLDASNGRVLWRRPADLPAWGSPVVSQGDVIVGLGNGRLTQPAEPPDRPAGALLCLHTDTGEARWRYDTADAVFAPATLTQQHVLFGARDGHCTCLDRKTGAVVWKANLGSPVMTTPVLAGERVYAVASAGRVCCLNAADGLAMWTFDVAAHSRTMPRLYSSPVVVAEDNSNGARQRIYFGSELQSGAGAAAVLYCLEDRLRIDQ